MKKQEFIQRNILLKLEKALLRSPVVLLTGARQTGKTTLVKNLCSQPQYSYITFDDLNYFSAAKNDPIGFISDIPTPVIFDEVQKVPELFSVIKQRVDENRRPGMFILTGSANPLLIPTLGDSLVGRMEILELFPFSQGELKGIKSSFIDNLFSSKFSALFPNTIKETKILTKQNMARKFLQGGYPLVQNLNEDDTFAWFDSYITMLLQRDIKDLANIEGLSHIPHLLHIIATRTGGLLNTSELSRSSSLSSTTLRRYLTLLQTVFLISFLPPWSKNLGKRLIKSPKIYLSDVGILTHLLKTDAQQFVQDPNLFSKVFENFIIMELLKQASWSKENTKLFIYRTQNGIEVDTVVENKKGNIVGIEIKGSTTVSHNDFKGLKHLQIATKKSFIRGIVIYMGKEIIPFGNNLWALPVSLV
jgi:uncharacterized protein